MLESGAQGVHCLVASRCGEGSREEDINKDREGVVLEELGSKVSVANEERKLRTYCILRSRVVLRTSGQYNMLGVNGFD